MRRCCDSGLVRQRGKCLSARCHRRTKCAQHHVPPQQIGIGILLLSEQKYNNCCDDRKNIAEGLIYFDTRLRSSAIISG